MARVRTRSHLSRKTKKARKLAEKRKLELLRQQSLQLQKPNMPMMALCDQCGLVFRKIILYQHLRSVHKIESEDQEPVNEDAYSAFGRRNMNLGRYYRRTNFGGEEKLRKSRKRCRNIFEDCFGAKYAAQILDDLVNEVTRKKPIMRMKVLDEAKNFVISIVTPFMRRIHETLKQSSEMAFMCSMGPLDILGSNVFLVTTNSFRGGLPLAVIITSSESSEAIAQGLMMIAELVSEAAFGGRGQKGPRLCMIKGDSAAERVAWLSAFSHTKVLFCQFQMMKAMRSHIAKRESDVHPSAKSTLLNMFKSLLYESNSNIFVKKVTETMYQDVTLLYPSFRKYLLQILKFQKHWASCHRVNFITRGQNSISICSSDIKIMKNAMNNRKARLPVDLLRIIAEVYQQHYTDELIQVANGLTPSHVSRPKKCNGLIYYRSLGKVFDPVDNQTYTLDLESNLCPCIKGIKGKICKHLFVALKNGNNESLLILPQTEEERKICFYIATGQYSLEENHVDCFKSSSYEERNAFEDITLASNAEDWSNSIKQETVDDWTDHYPTTIKQEDAGNWIENVKQENVGAYKETVFVSVGVEHDNIKEEAKVDGAFEELDYMFTDLKTKISGNPALCASAKEMLSSYKSISTTRALESAIFNFGKQGYTCTTSRVPVFGDVRKGLRKSEKKARISNTFLEKPESIIELKNDVLQCLPAFV